MDLKKAEKNILKNLLEILLPSPVSSNFGRYLFCSWGVLGHVVALPSRFHRGRPSKFWLFCILNSSKNCSCGSATKKDNNLSISKWISFYTFKSLGVWVWYPKPVYQLQNSFGYGTATKLEFWQTLKMSVLCSLANLA